MKSPNQLAFRKIEDSIQPLLSKMGFRGRQKTYVRPTSDELTQVLNFQLGRFDPPGTVHIPSFRESLYGKFTVNLGVFIPEVLELSEGRTLKAIHEYDCHIQSRLGMVGPKQSDIWWDLKPTDDLIVELTQRIERDATTFFSQFETRDKVLNMGSGKQYWGQSVHGSPPYLVCALIQFKRGNAKIARDLLINQQGVGHHAAHHDYLRTLFIRLQLGEWPA